MAREDKLSFMTHTKIVLTFK